jgi:glycosyltransferase involved in cell wall biosynthesis
MVLVEALAQGCPVLSVDCSHGPAEIIGNDEYGKLIKSYKIEDHAAALLDFINQPVKDKMFYQQRAAEFDIVKSAENHLQLVDIQ